MAGKTLKNIVVIASAPCRNAYYTMYENKQGLIRTKSTCGPGLEPHGIHTRAVKRFGRLTETRRRLDGDGADCDCIIRVVI
jgi:hypothetical protein